MIIRWKLSSTRKSSIAISYKAPSPRDATISATLPVTCSGSSAHALSQILSEKYASSDDHISVLAVAFAKKT